MTLTDTIHNIAQDTPDTALNGNRKLIRPRLPVVDGNRLHKTTRTNGNAAHVLTRKQAPVNFSEGVSQPEPSHAEVFYFQKQVQAQTPMVVLLDDGEKLEGIIEWFDKDSLKLRLTNLQRVLVYKTAIKFIHKAGEATA
jgi:sRNA-binding regulator protein Hfq